MRPGARSARPASRPRRRASSRTGRVATVWPVCERLEQRGAQLEPQFGLHELAAGCGDGSPPASAGSGRRCRTGARCRVARSTSTLGGAYCSSRRWCSSPSAGCALGGLRGVARRGGPRVVRPHGVRHGSGAARAARRGVGAEDAMLLVDRGEQLAAAVGRSRSCRGTGKPPGCSAKWNTFEHLRLHVAVEVDQQVAAARRGRAARTADRAARCAARTAPARARSLRRGSGARLASKNRRSRVRRHVGRDRLRVDARRAPTASASLVDVGGEDLHRQARRPAARRARRAASRASTPPRRWRSRRTQTRTWPVGGLSLEQLGHARSRSSASNASRSRKKLVTLISMSRSSARSRSGGRCR